MVGENYLMLQKVTKQSPDIQDYAELHKDTPFEWNKFDCTTFAFGWIDQRYGTKFVEDFIKGRYNSERTARRFAEMSGPEWAYLEVDIPTTEVVDGFQTKGDLLCYSYECWNPIALVLSPNRVAVVSGSGLHIVKPEHIIGKYKYLRIG